MSQKIGRQDGIDWIVSILRKIPGVKYRPLGDRPLSLEQWYGLEKYERTLRILKDDHDAAITLPLPAPPGPIKPDPKPPTSYTVVAPKTANMQGGSDARFCVDNQPGVIRQADGTYKDDVARYAADGLHLGGRSDKCTNEQTPGLVGAKEMDGRAPCQLPRVGDPLKNTGSWEV